MLFCPATCMQETLMVLVIHRAALQRTLVHYSTLLWVGYHDTNCIEGFQVTLTSLINDCLFDFCLYLCSGRARDWLRSKPKQNKLGREILEISRRWKLFLMAAICVASVAGCSRPKHSFKPFVYRRFRASATQATIYGNRSKQNSVLNIACVADSLNPLYSACAGAHHSWMMGSWRVWISSVDWRF